jgi:hypothetical protein
MLDREACERRVYRLATLLTGNPVAATKVIAQVVDAQPDLRGLDSAHMDRLTVLRSREIKPAVLVSDHVPVAVAEALASLTAQQREAWVFSRVYQMDSREMARAMDCSVTATQRHIEQADSLMGERVGTVAGAGEGALRTYSMSLDVPRFYRIDRRRRARTRAALKWMVIGAAAILLAALALWWTRPLNPN